MNSRKLMTDHRALPIVGVALAVLLAGAPGCGHGHDDANGAGLTDPSVDPSSDPNCVSTTENFTSQVYGKALASCLSCHVPGGQADQQGARFKIYPDTYPDFVNANIEAMREFAKVQVDGKPLLLEKPLGEQNHGGGAVLTENSDAYQILTKFVDDLQSGVTTSCNGDVQLGVRFIDNRTAARKAAITLAARFPSDEELESVSTDDGLKQFVLALTHEEPFYDRLREIWNDALFTQRPVNGTYGNQWGNAPLLFDDKAPGYTDTNNHLMARAMTEEPLRLIEYIVRNGLPFSDVVSADYVVANPYLAATYGLPHSKSLISDNWLEWERVAGQPTQLYQDFQDGTTKTAHLPSAGVLTTTSFLLRWESTPTNRGRKRARIILKNFLATDILKVAQRPIDAAAASSIADPTINDPTCSVCHSTVDPIAGGYRGFVQDFPYIHFDSTAPWYDDMAAPGFNGAAMPSDQYGDPIAWLGAQIPKDPRFALSVVRIMYKGIIGDDPLDIPADKTLLDYEDRVRAYTIQNDEFGKIATKFTAANFDLREVIVALVESAYFRALSGDPSRDGLHSGLGQGRLLTPEMLSRKIKAVTGQYFHRNSLPAYDDPERARDQYLVNDLMIDSEWNFVYGGIDSGETTSRAETMSPIMVAMNEYVAAVAACQVTAYDFTKTPATRRFFKTVEMDTMPFLPRASASDPLVAVADAEPKIRETIKGLFFRFLGDTVESDSEEVTAVYGLFVDAWKDAENTDVMTGGQNKGLMCSANADIDQGPAKPTPQAWGSFAGLADRPAGAPYQPGMKITTDEHFTIRAWQAVLTYLFTDYHFTHE